MEVCPIGYGPGRGVLGTAFDVRVTSRSAIAVGCVDLRAIWPLVAWDVASVSKQLVDTWAPISQEEICPVIFLSHEQYLHVRSLLFFTSFFICDLWTWVLVGDVDMWLRHRHLGWGTLFLLGFQNWDRTRKTSFMPVDCCLKSISLWHDSV
jgi:hypothetical protein